jgi:hypothetical protein
MENKLLLLLLLYFAVRIPLELLLASLLLLTFLLSDSGGPAAVDNDVPIVPAAAVISDFKSVPPVVGFPARRLHYFCKHPLYCWHHYCVGHPFVAFTPVCVLHFCCCGHKAVMLLLT